MRASRAVFVSRRLRKPSRLGMQMHGQHGIQHAHRSGRGARRACVVRDGARDPDGGAATATAITMDAAVAIAFGRWREKYVLSTPAVVSVKPASRWHDWITCTFLITVALHVKPSKPASQAQLLTILQQQSKLL